MMVAILLDNSIFDISYMCAKPCLLLYSMEETIPAKLMSCIKLSNENQKQTAQHPSGLCTVCQEIDFVSLTSEAGVRFCEECVAKDDRHFHIGELRNVARKQFCPGCRLILSVVRSMDPSDNDFSEGTLPLNDSLSNLIFGSQLIVCLKLRWTRITWGDRFTWNL